MNTGTVPKGRSVYLTERNLEAIDLLIGLFNDDLEAGAEFTEEDRAAVGELWRKRFGQRKERVIHDQPDSHQES